MPSTPVGLLEIGVAPLELEHPCGGDSEHPDGEVAGFRVVGQNRRGNQSADDRVPYVDAVQAPKGEGLDHIETGGPLLVDSRYEGPPSSQIGG